MDTIEISVSIADLTKKIKQHLSVIGKRTKDVGGNSLYSDLTTSTAEDAVVWADMLAGGADTLVSTLSIFSGSYSNNGTTISFKVMSERWKDLNADDAHDITVALKESIARFIWNYAIKEFLDMIHPSTGKKYPPLFATPYETAMAYSINTIKDLAFLKRPAKKSAVQYENVTGEIVNS